MRLDEPLEPVAGTDLLVGGGDEDEVAGAAPAFACERRQRDRRRRDFALHVERSASPDLAVWDQLTPEGIALPLGGVGEHDVGVREERKRRPVAGPADAGDEVRALGHARVELTLDTGRLQVVAQELGSRGLVAGRIRGVDADEPLQQLGYFTHLRAPRTSR